MAKRIKPTSPAPWRAEADGYVFDADNEIVASAEPQDGPLIAAAPEMLAALKRIKIVMDGVIHPNMRHPDDALSEVEAAIAKAELAPSKSAPPVSTQLYEALDGLLMAVEHVEKSDPRGLGQWTDAARKALAAAS